jgi:hypothetical protein
MFASPCYYIRNQVIEENKSFNLLPSLDVQGHASVKEHENISTFVTLTVCNKRQACGNDQN